MAADTQQHEPVSAAASAIPCPDSAAAPAMPPLTVAGLVVTKADLLVVLRAYVAQLVDIDILDGDRFLLSLVAPGPREKGSVKWPTSSPTT